jgi:hypothetical protein
LARSLAVVQAACAEEAMSSLQAIRLERVESVLAPANTPNRIHVPQTSADARRS